MMITRVGQANQVQPLSARFGALFAVRARLYSAAATGPAAVERAAGAGTLGR